MHSSTAAQAASSLPPKEAKLLKQLFKFHETKQYKKGIKSANQILEKFPDHPETNSLKGLFMYQSGEQDEGFKLAKNALMKNFKSELCWHILGILNRSQSKYVDAISCYKQALKYDPDNVTILRDLAALQVHTRELDSHQETRRTLLANKTNLPVNWIAFAVSEHLIGNYEQTLTILQSFRNVVKDDELKPYEKSELILYEVMVMQEMGNHEGALKYLEKHDKAIVDRTAFNELAAKSALALNQPERAEPFIKFLFEKYPENRNNIDLLRQQKGLQTLTEENRQQIADLHNDLIKTYPTSQAFKRNQLNFLKGEEFKQKFDAYLRPFFSKALPSVFIDVRELLKDAEKLKIVEDLVVAHSKSLAEKQTFSGSETVENPCCELWSYLFLASLYSFKGQYKEGLEYIEKAIQHTPTLNELYTIKAKIFKANLNYKVASDLADKSRNMDLADRYPNNLTVKYMLRNNQIDASEALLKTFIRDSNDANIHELQYQWYELEVGNANLRLNQFGPGLRQFKFIEKHFNDFYEDQFDFHTYCLRKYVLRQYINMIRNADNIYNNKWYIKATIAMIRGLQAYEAYLPEIQKQEEEEKKKLEAMDVHERKKYKKEKEAKEKEADPEKEKLDLKGKKYIEELKNPIDEACKFANRLLNADVEEKYRVDLYTEICNLYIKKGKILLAIKAYNKVAKLAAQNGAVHLARVRLIEALEKTVADAAVNPDLKPIFEEELAAIKSGSDAKKIHEEFKKNAKSLINEVKGVEGDILLGLLAKDKAAKTVEDLVTKHKGDAQIKEVVYVLNKLKDAFGGDAEGEKRIKGLFKERFNLCPVFNEEAVNIKPIEDVAPPVLG